MGMGMDRTEEQRSGVETWCVVAAIMGGGAGGNSGSE